MHLEGVEFRARHIFQPPLHHGFIANKKVLPTIIILIVIREVLQPPTTPLPTTLTPRNRPTSGEYASRTKLQVYTYDESGKEVQRWQHSANESV